MWSGEWGSRVGERDCFGPDEGDDVDRGDWSLGGWSLESSSVALQASGATKDLPSSSMPLSNEITASALIVKKERVSLVWANSLTGGIWEMQYVPGQIPARDERVPHVVPSAFR